MSEDMKEGRFRDDLYYRLNVFPIQLPPLRERTSDIPALVGHFLRQFAREAVEEYELDPAAMELLTAYSWRGNVRELQNAIERAVLLCEGGRITPSLFPFLETGTGDSSAEVSIVVALSYREAMERLSNTYQKQYLTEVLKMYGANVTRAAEHAGIERESFHRLMRKCGVTSDDVKKQLADDT